MQNVTAFEIKRALAVKHHKDFFITECKSGSTWLTPTGDMKILDGLAIRKSWTSPCFTGYEVKVSRGDFLRDAKFYTYEELCNCLYMVCPKGMIKREELPESIGLMYYDPESKGLSTKKKAIYRKIDYSPKMLLYIIYSKLDNDRIPFYSSTREYFEAYLANKDEKLMLGHQISSRLINDNRALAKQIDELQHFKHDYESYKTVQEVMRKHDIWGWRSAGIAEELDKALTMKCPNDISVVKMDLERALARIKRMEESYGQAE